MFCDTLRSLVLAAWSSGTSRPAWPSRLSTWLKRATLRASQRHIARPHQTSPPTLLAEAERRVLTDPLAAVIYADGGTRRRFQARGRASHVWGGPSRAQQTSHRRSCMLRCPGPTRPLNLAHPLAAHERSTSHTDLPELGKVGTCDKVLGPRRILVAPEHSGTRRPSQYVGAGTEQNAAQAWSGVATVYQPRA